MDCEQSAGLGRLNYIAAKNRRQGQVASHQVQIIAWQQNDVASSKRKLPFVLAVGPDAELTLNDVVIKNQLRCRPKNGCAMLWRNASGHTPRREEVGV